MNEIPLEKKMKQIKSIQTKSELLQYNQYHTDKLVRTFQLQNQFARDEFTTQLNQLASKIADRLKIINKLTGKKEQNGKL